ncbi:GNAT family N-acetyltransferase [Burkholderia singularis]|uniref:Acetyltransferase, GNAT family n=1 Tax=Burkholderia singularis TaxID=1503053 RepID=A0A238H3P1_9BURK|nr:GNAT family protein [Burkholderia singularis]SMF99745.1 Acetyltransferase, GNAT family [Burkholderia singularis]
MRDEIQLRGLRRNDSASLVEFMSGNNFIHGLTVLPYISEYDVQRLVEPSDTRHWIIAALNDQAIGYVYLEWGKGRWRNIAMLAIGVADQHVRKGVGRKLLNAALWLGFRYLDLHKIELVVYADNEPAIRLYDSVGFVREGMKRRNAFRDGHHPDALVMSILQSDYESSRR